MALTVTALAAALRIGDGVNPPAEPQLSILNRLSGVADAFVELIASGAPDAVKNESAARFASYLYDQPTAARGDRYAAAWVNSGAAALVSRWATRRIVAAE